LQRFSFELLLLDESPIIKCEDPWDRDVPSLQTVIPLETTAAYDMLDVIKEVSIEAELDHSTYTYKL